MPKSNTDYWKPKLLKNVERDREHLKQLEANGWSVEVVWECETKDAEELRSRLTRFLDG